MDANIQDLLDAGVHFGHQSRYWNPKMRKYIYGTYNHINIINLEHTLSGLRRASEFVNDLARNRKKLLMVGTKKAARDIIRDHAVEIGQYYVNHRWMGGTLTNYSIICASIDKLSELQKQKAEGMFEKLTKKEAMMRTRAMLKLERNIGGIKDMNGLPDALFVVDVRHERIAVAEAKKLGIPIIGVVDSNSNPDDIDYIIPGNDDSIRSITLIVSSIVSSFQEGGQLAEQYAMRPSAEVKKEETKAKDERIEGTLSKPREQASPSNNSQANPSAGPVESIADAPSDTTSDIPADVPSDIPSDIKEQQTTDNEKTEDNRNSADAMSDDSKAQTIEATAAAAEQPGTAEKGQAAKSPIAAAAVKQLREMSGAGIMECKTALQEAQGDIDKAAEILRKKGITKQLKRADREVSEGIISIKSDGNRAIAVVINCETDFVARNDDFVSFAEKISTKFYDKEPDLDGDTPVLDNDTTEELQQMGQKIGEKLLISKYLSVEAPQSGCVGAYVHNNGKLCSLVTIDKAEPQLAFDLAMQVAAMAPMAVKPEDIPQADLDKEKEIFLAQIDDKPDDIKDKMIAGKLKKFAAENSLTEQKSIKDPDKKIADIIAAADIKEVTFTRHSI